MSKWTIVAHTSKQSTDGQHVTTDPIDTTGANLVVVFASLSQGFSGPTDNKGNAWGRQALSAWIYDAHLWDAGTAPIVGSGHTFSLDGGSTSALPTLCVLALRGPGGLGFDFATTNFALSSTSTIQLPTLTPRPGSLIITGVDDFAAPVSVDSGFTIIESVTAGINSQSAGLAYLETDNPVSPTWTIAFSNFPSAVMVSYSAPADINTLMGQACY
jgi:hypothetical protein